MLTNVHGSDSFQVLTSSFSISPSEQGYVLNISANGKDFSPLFTVGAGVTRLVTGMASGSYYKLVGNEGDVVVNWVRSCVTPGGDDKSSALTPVSDVPLNADAGTVIAYSGSSSAAGIYQFDGTEWNVAGGQALLDDYWTSAETQSAITAVEDHLFDVEQVTASALTELHDDVLELSARTVDLSPYYTSAQTEDAILAKHYITSAQVEDQIIAKNYVVSAQVEDQIIAKNYVTSAQVEDQIIAKNYITSAQTEDAIDEAISSYTPTANFATINGSAITNGGNIVIQGGGGDMSDYWTSAQTQTAISAATQDMVTSTSVSTIWRGTQAEYDAITTKDPNTFYIIVSN